MSTVKKWLLTSITPIIIAIAAINIGICTHINKAWPIPSIAYTITVATLIATANTVHNQPYHIDFEANLPLRNKQWRKKAVKSLLIFIILSIAYYLFIILL